MNDLIAVLHSYRRVTFRYRNPGSAIAVDAHSAEMNNVALHARFDDGSEQIVRCV
jgi:hypothetical protein